MLFISAYDRVLIDCYVFSSTPAVESDHYCLLLLRRRWWGLLVREMNRFLSICITIICKLLCCIHPRQYRPVGRPNNRRIRIVGTVECVGVWATGTNMDGGDDDRPNR